MRTLAQRLFLGVLTVAAVVSVAAWFVPGSNAQGTEYLVVEGERMDGIRIGKSNSEDVIRAYGDNFKLLDHNSYSYEMLYRDLGLSFYYCQNDPNREIFVVEIEAPARARTAKGIVLGESTMADVREAYGDWDETSAGFEYEDAGIYFDVREDTDGDEGDDARYVIKTEKPTRETTELPPPAENRNVVVDPEALRALVSNRNETERGTISRVEVPTPSPSTEEIAEPEAPDEDEPEKETPEIEEAPQTVNKSDEDRYRVVRRFELIEKGGLRQCDSKFPRR